VDRVFFNVPSPRRLQQKKTMMVKWIAERLRMGAPGYVNQLLHRQKKAKQ
jgi:hypothetical protein